MPGKPTPKHLAMLLCDYLILDAETRNKSLIGIFHRIQALKFPVRHDRMHVFVALTDGHGEYKASLKVKNSTGKQILSLDGKVDMRDPLGVAEINFNIRGLVIPEPGRYFVEFWCDNELIVDRHFDAAMWQPPQVSGPFSPTLGSGPASGPDGSGPAGDGDKPGGDGA